jgi:excisionase family DNA binding protein
LAPSSSLKKGGSEAKGMRASESRTSVLEVSKEDRCGPIPPLGRLTVRVPEAAQLLSISRAAVYRLLAGGELEFAKNGQKSLVIVASIKAFVERNRK